METYEINKDTVALIPKDDKKTMVKRMGEVQIKLIGSVSATEIIRTPIIRMFVKAPCFL